MAMALLVSARMAHAQPLTDDPCLRDVSCQRLLARAQASSQEQRYEEALVTYQKAYSLSQASWILVNIGRMQHKLTYYQEAKQSYLRYLETPRLPGDDEQRTTALDFLHQTEAELAKQQTVMMMATSTVPATAAPRPVYKKWWFWTIIGGVVAGGVAGTIAGVYASKPSLPAVPADAQFHPF